ncbi:MAG: hypothetical protein L3K17_03330 [Thermoplasmata archaeon]|nr:hypothetical protein [Thermoplasmata archaeon]
MVSAFDPEGQVVGVWNFLSSNWQSGSNWLLPSTYNISVIFDTGLPSNATLSNAYFYVILTEPNHGALGLPLFCAEC